VALTAEERPFSDDYCWVRYAPIVLKNSRLRWV
jgi:hypothetical protein